MRPTRSALLFALPLFAGCQMLAELEYQEPQVVPSQRLRGELVQQDGQWWLSPCHQQRRLRLQSAEHPELLRELQALSANGSAKLYGDYKGRLQGGENGTFDLTRRYRLEAEGHGCDDPSYKRTRLIAQGHEPDWRLAVSGQGLVLERPGQAPLALPYLEEDMLEGRRNFSSAANGQQLELWVSPQACADGMSGAVSHLRAQLRLDGQRLEGCAYYGGAQDD